MDKQRFEKYIEKTETCWKWTGGKDIKNYGIFFYKGKTQLAHRTSLLIYERVKRLTPGLQVLHSCRDKSCVNPDHLREGTHTDNCHDKRRDGTNLTGDKCHFSKLSWGDVNEIRKTKYNPYTPKQLATRYEVSISTIHNILNNKTWVVDETPAHTPSE